MFAPRSIEHDKTELFGLDELGEVVVGHGKDCTWGWYPVGVIESHHVVDNGLDVALARVVLKLLSVLEDDESRVSLNKVFLGKFNLLGHVDLGQMNTMLLQLGGGLRII
jgi:hypothetical protein